MNFIAEQLSLSDIYLSASIEEAGANHVLEAMASGLPVVYHKKGGSINNYCRNYGLSFDDKDSMLDAIKTVKENYQFYKSNVMRYNDTIDNVIEKYVEKINEIICS